MFLYSSISQFRFQNLYNEVDNGEFLVEIISNKEEKQYVNKYICLVRKYNKLKKYKNTKLILYTDKNYNLNYGDIVLINGNFEYVEEARNYKGYNYRRTLWQNKIFGVLNAYNIKIISHNKSLDSLLNKLKNKIELNIDSCIENEQYSGFLKGIIIGNKSNLSEEIKTNFKEASLSHVLAISGMHIGYIVVFLKQILKFVNSKKMKDFLEILIIYTYIKLVGFSPSSIRAGIMFGMIIISENIFRKSIAVINCFTSLIVILIINPFYIENTGLWLSFLGTLGIITIYEKINIKKSNPILNYIYQNFLLSFSVQLCIFPIIIYNYNTISLTFFISNIIISFFIVPVMIFGFTLGLFGKKYIIGKPIIFLESFFIKIIFYSAKFMSKMGISKIYVKTPNIIYIIFYYLIGFILIYKKQFLFYLKFVIVLLVIVTIIISGLELANNKFCIFFIDVGQGDCTLIKTKNNKTVLIDGGEGNSGKFDEGKNTVIPYLLDRGISKLDYVIVSHFDSDHVRSVYLQ